MTSDQDGDATSPSHRRSGVYRSFSWVLGGRILAAALQALLLALVARESSPAEFGLLAAVTGFAVAAVAWLDLGLSTHIVRERSVDQFSGHVTKAIALSRRQAVLLLCLGALSLLLLALFSDSRYWMLIPLSLWCACERQADILMSLRLADGKPIYNSLNLVLRRLFAVVLFIPLIILEIDAILAYTMAVSVASFLSLVGAILATRNFIYQTDTSTFREVIKRSRFYWLNSAATQTRNLDSAVVSFFAGAHVSGVYSVASRLTTPLRMFPTAMATATMPIASRLISRRASIRPLLRSSLVTVGATVLLSAALCLVAPPLMVFGLGEDYAASVIPTQIVIASLPIAAIASLQSSVLQGAGLSRLVGVTAAVTTGVALTFVIVGSILSGAIGAAIGLASSFAVQAIILGVGLIRGLARVYKEDPEVFDEE